ncbi:MAG TPA: putative dsRNA-binding protein, partial [Dokdonella sp.]
LLQGRNHALPLYELVGASGEDHARVFEVACRVDELGVCAQGSATSRRAAEQAAAERVLLDVQRKFDDQI